MVDTVIDISLGAERPGPSSEEKLLKAVEWLKGYIQFALKLEHGGEINPEFISTLEDVVEHVPKLLEAYAELGLLTAGLMSAVEQEREGKTASGLVLPK